MTVAILLVSHKGVASTILNTTGRIWHEKPVKTDYIEVEFDADIEHSISLVEEKLEHLDDGDGVLVMTDLVGATPCNLVTSLTHKNILAISGLNLPMLMRAYNYPQEPLDELAALAIEGGKRGIALLSQAVCNPVSGT